MLLAAFEEDFLAIKIFASAILDDFLVTVQESNKIKAKRLAVCR